MPDQDKNSSFLDVKTTAVLVAIVLGGATMIPTPLRSSRPSETRFLERTSMGDQVVPARLWQDPLQAALDYRAKHPGGALGVATEDAGTTATNTQITLRSLSEISQQIGRRHRSGKPITVLEVMISGGSYAEDAEQRQRARYAVVSAIGVAGYVPVDAEHLGYAQTWWPQGKELETNEGQTPAVPDSQADSTLIVPFEWFSPDGLRDDVATSGPVIVLWLNDDAFADHPLKRLAQFNDEIRRQAVTNDPSPPLNLTFKLLEPRLQPMLAELGERKPDPASGSTAGVVGTSMPDALTNLEFYSSWSTTADALLEQGRGAFTNPPGCSPWSFTQVTCTDDELAEELIDELYLRHIDVTCSNDCVVLISEWDTFYGRALPLTFAAMVKCRINDRFTTGSFINITNLFTLLKDQKHPATPDVRERLSYSTRRLLEGPDPPPELDVALARDFDNLIDTDLHQLAGRPWCSGKPELAPLRQTNSLSPGKRAHLNRVLLEAAFPQTIRTSSFPAAVKQLDADPAAWPSNIVRCTYLRGIDGKSPEEDAEANPSDQAAKSARDDNLDDSDNSTPRPEGHRQLDYMPRLADRLLREEKLFKRYGRGEFKAIGILGSDIYDKLLVLQSLRRQFTDEVFFTTDLDARLLHPSALKWTRNVLVASSFGLQLGWRFQRQTPPFRDTYQAGQYLCCLAALDYPGVRANLPGLAPRRFEVGRKGAYDLSRQTSNLYPKIPRLLPWTHELFFDDFGWLGAGLMLAALAGLCNQRARAALRLIFAAVAGPPSEATVRSPPEPFNNLKSWWTFRLLVSMPVLVVVALCVCIVWDHHWNREGEPFSMTSGISIWPTEILRLLAAWLAIHFLFKAYASLCKNRDELREELGSDPGSDPALEPQPSPPGNPEVSWNDILLNWDLEEGDGEGARQKPSKRQVFDDYCRLGSPRQRILRAALPALCYGGLMYALWQVFDHPFQPSRGSLSLWWDQSIELVSNGLLVFLVFFVTDSSRLCRKFIDNLMVAQGQWPPGFGRNLCPQEHLDGHFLDDFIDLRVIASRSSAVGQLILYPFFILFLLIVARNDFFDRWDWPAWVLLFFGLNAAYAVYVVWALRRSAEQARGTLLRRLNQKLLGAQCGTKDGLVDPLQLLISEVESCQEGAFAPVTQQPVIKALLMPFGGAGVITLLNYLAGKV